MVNVASFECEKFVRIRASLRTNSKMSLLELLDLMLYCSTERRTEKLPVSLAINALLVAHIT